MPTPQVIAPKKLIEVALPLDDINKACAREKSIRHGHPSTLHLWWARRPLAAARAVLFGQLVNDPSWRYTEEELKKNQVKGAVTKKRNELFKLITELVQWESTTDADVLERARREIRASWKETCEANKGHPDAKALFDPERLPVFHDPFAGGGALPLEAQRLGLEAHATDLNPVAVLINKAMLELPPGLGGRPPVGPMPKGDVQTTARGITDWAGPRGLAEDVRRYGHWLMCEAQKRTGWLYPTVEITKDIGKERPDLKPLVGQKLTVIAWIWARTVKSPNPAFSRVDVPLASSFVLATKPGKEVYVQPVVAGQSYRFRIQLGKPKDGDAATGTKLGRGANFRCLMSNAPIAPEYIKAQAVAGAMGSRLMAVVAEGSRGRIYLSPTSAMEELAQAASPVWRPETPLPEDPRNFWTLAYGLTRFGDLFTKRQLVTLCTLCDLVEEVVDSIRRDAIASGMRDDDVSLAKLGTGARAYAEGVATYLGLSVARYANASSTICTWNPGQAKEDIRFTFSRQSLPMTWDFAEGNPFSDSSGNFGDNISTWVFKAMSALPATPVGYASQANATDNCPITGTVTSTDPPYYDNIGYADLSDFFYLWLRRCLKRIYPDLFATIAVPKMEELVANPYRHGGTKEAESFFLDGMTRAIHGISERAHPAFPVTIYYAFKQADTTDDDGTASTGWETFLQAVLDAGLGLTGTWPMRTERGGRSIGIGTNALASSIILVCRPRLEAAHTIARKDFLRQLERALPISLAEMIADPEAAVAPVDLAQAAIGPGMAIFSKYKAVLEADGEPMTVHNALIHINKAIDRFFAEAEGDLDADTRFCIDWFQQHGFDAGAFGEADVLARAKGTAVDGVVEAGVLSATKGKVRLHRVKDYPKNWDPQEDSRVPIWEACHQMCRALGSSERDAGVLLARMPEKQDAIRQLAYRLFTICERQKWAEEARSYNDLITSWPVIVEQSHAVGHKGTQLELV